MDDNQTNAEPKDTRLWNIARKRAAFKRHLTSYVLVNAVLWAFWLFNYLSHSVGQFNIHLNYQIPWPAYVSFFWGIGLLFDFHESYYSSKGDMVEREYQKLKNKNNL